MLVQFLIGAVACISSITIMVGTVSLPMLAHRAEVFVRAAIYELVDRRHLRRPAAGDHAPAAAADRLMLVKDRRCARAESR